MHLDRLALHVGQHRRAAAERQQRQHAEHRGDLQQRRDHRARSSRVTARLAGSITSSTSSSGMRRMPMPTMMAPAISAGPRRRMLRQREPEAGGEVEADRGGAGAGQRGVEQRGCRTPPCAAK